MPKYAMSDSRAFTNYFRNFELNNSIQKNYNISSAQEYRYFLQKNADKLRSELFKCDSKEEDCKFCPVCKEAIKA